MRYGNEFRNRDDVKRLVELIKSSKSSNINIMEVCGTHTMSIAAAGIKQMLPPYIRLISGPGCPVCVTPSERIDDACSLSMNKDIIIATYGDMLRVPGTRKDISLERSRSRGADVRIVYSSMDALNIAVNNKSKEVVFLGIGFETTAPATSIAIIEAGNSNIKNFSVLCLHKTVEPVLRGLLESDEVKVDAFLLPGNVSVILGQKGFEFLQKDYKIPGVIAGFEPSDILKAIYMIMKQLESGSCELENEYTRLVSYEGNKTAQKAIYDVLEPYDDIWRGLGIIKASGLRIKDRYRQFDAGVKMNIKYTDEVKNTACMCGQVLKGVIESVECPLFGDECCPDSPVGPCMVSSEGSCAAAYKYR